MLEEMDVARRFGGVARLYGSAGLIKLQAAHVVVIGVGGVGAWATEALARNAVGSLTLIDLDNVAESNFNRQLHAVEANIGKAKVTAMAERIRSIHPMCQVREVEDFVTPENIETILDFHCDVIIDCTDDTKAKIALADFCQRKKISLIMSGGAGGRLDPTRINIADLSAVTGDKLLAKVRTQLRRDYGFPKASSAKKSAKFSIACVYSDEPVIKPQLGDYCENDSNTITGLNCAGYGSSVNVTAAFGFAAVYLACNQLLKV